MRGEKYPRALMSSLYGGSSPRAWGKVRGHGVYTCADRIIPTCVGKRLLAVTFMLSDPDHPHVRGEKLHVAVLPSAKRGSSPRAWGKAAPARPALQVLRIIPTCVGKSIPYAVGSTFMPDHPHVRGEKDHLARQGCPQHGSSPRAWGKGVRRSSTLWLVRIIPTCVGKRKRKVTEMSKFADHPHVRGEKAFTAVTAAIIPGSSPRAWGKEQVTLQ